MAAANMRTLAMTAATAMSASFLAACGSNAGAQTPAPSPTTAPAPVVIVTELPKIEAPYTFTPGTPPRCGFSILTDKNDNKVLSGPLSGAVRLANQNDYNQDFETFMDIAVDANIGTHYAIDRAFCADNNKNIVFREFAVLTDLWNKPDDPSSPNNYDIISKIFGADNAHKDHKRMRLVLHDNPANDPKKCEGNTPAFTWNTCKPKDRVLWRVQEGDDISKQTGSDINGLNGTVDQIIFANKAPTPATP